MNIEKNVQINNYFEYRNIDSSLYEKSKVPLWIKNELDNTNKILDYGCGFGQLLEALKTENYTNCYGVDIENKSIIHCLNNGLNVKNIKNLTNPFSFKFDVIVLSHVIEHIEKIEIIKTLSVLRQKFLTENGKLLIAVPNAQSNTGSYWAYEDWTHTTLFTSGSLYYVLKAAGFESVEFIDIDSTLGCSRKKTLLRKFFIKIYKLKINFWNEITCSSYHKPSPEIFSYEIKAKAYSTVF